MTQELIQAVNEMLVQDITDFTTPVVVKAANKLIKLAKQYAAKEEFASANNMFTEALVYHELRQGAMHGVSEMFSRLCSLGYKGKLFQREHDVTPEENGETRKLSVAHAMDNPDVLPDGISVRNFARWAGFNEVFYDR